MRNTVWLGLIFAACSAAFAACGGSGGGNTSTEGTGDQGTGGNTSMSSSASSGTGGTTTTSSSSSGSTTTSSSSGSTTTSSSTSAASSSGSSLVNGCNPATAEDHTADSNVMISFGGTTGLKYSPACIKINKGSSLTFNGSFSSHPLSGGLDGSADASSPITHTTTGSTATFPFPNAGTFGFYCDFHFGSGMEGAVFVQ